MKVNSDFVSDLRNIMREILENKFNLDTSMFDDKKISEVFFDIRLRTPIMQPRKIEQSDAFTPPVGDGWEKLKKAILKGEDLMPYLSKSILCISDKQNKRDKLLYDWGIYHLHIGTKFEENSPYIERTKYLIFAFITDETFYAIKVLPHERWTEVDILEIVHRNWPHLLEAYRLRDTISKPIDEMVEYRKHNINYCFSLKDGTSFFNPGGGFMSNGFSMKSYSNLMYEEDRARLYEIFAKEYAIAYCTSIGVDEGYEIDLKLLFHDDKFKAVVHDLGILIDLSKVNFP